MNLKSEILKKKEELIDLEARDFNFTAITDSERRRSQYHIVITFDREEEYDEVMERGKALKAHPRLQREIGKLIKEYKKYLQEGDA